MENYPIWQEDAAPTAYPPLSGEIETDVAIIGGGITGLTTAYLLGKAGIKTVVLEAKNISGGNTGHSTGELYALVDENYHVLRQKYNGEKTALIAEGRTSALQLVRDLVNEHNIPCHLENVSWFLLSETGDDTATIENEYEACKQIGLNAHLENQSPLPFPVKRSLRIEGQAQINPQEYAKALAEKTDPVVSIYENSQVIAITEGEKHILRTENGLVKAKYIIHATHTPKGIMAIQSFLGPYREYTIALEDKNNLLPPGIYHTNKRPHNYAIRQYENTNGEKYVVVHGEPHKAGQKVDNEACFSHLEEYIRERMELGEVKYRWAEQHYRPADGLPYIGRRDKKGTVYFATGFSGDGLIYGTLAGKILSDEILGTENKYAELFAPTRHNPLKSAAGFLKENLNVLVQFAKDLPHKSEIEKFSDVKHGEGKIIELDDEKYAAHRDHMGKFHIVSAVCTHMKCIVNWNSAEQTWDCPCHGSRYTPDGQIIEGPAITNLSRMKGKNEK
ncbi:MAG TPA: FAD-dependent oxidoreductase [Bacteroidia bacterium]|nr:FAD-dependent oxidoreductase [Bacteroidia bacterium]